ncbi:hypothetical protein Q5P01_008431 [Channa striata]|uniref:SEFIR domain-containing protein n=1 Tax=Channa striata TaxID=64152 RepID=A0AA88SSP5_CHASR|nr:hypothetical protein Q5P01_008431 [Channa striata]
MSSFRALLLLLCAALSSAVRVLTWAPVNCSTQGLRCTVTTSNCMDRGWLKSYQFTPSGPEALQVSVDLRQDEMGQLQPVLLANWTLKDEGSIAQLEATELHVLVISTNHNLCVRYTLKEKLEQMRSPSGEKWAFSSNMVVLDPGQEYRVSVFNIPKPELGHSSYDVSKDISVPDCQDASMQMTQFCIERGSLWRPNITLTRSAAVRGKSALTVGFSPDALCEEYIVIVSCSTTQHAERTYQANQTILQVTFSLEKWPRSCCQFDVEIKPLFKQCGQDCTRRRGTLDICPAKPKDKANVPAYTYICVAFAVILICVVTANIIKYVICRKPGKRGDEDFKDENLQQPQLQHPKVLVIYSQDHYLYKDVVLKLCAFLQAKCGTEVLVDLLDSTSVGMVGRVRWLEWQRQQLKNPSDKILVLCSQGVQAKWRALCGQGQVTLREDLLSPTDDMLTPFLNLFLPDMHRAGMLGKYMVAYFDDISSEQDVPSVFDIAVKYKLMKHFEELYFRIVDIEKYQPGLVNHIEGIGGEEYFNCPSGRALKNAIEVFQAYQLENPDWFEKECVESEEDVMTEASLLIGQLNIPPVLECVPQIKDGPPVYAHEVEIAENGSSVHVLTPEVNPEQQLLSVVELTPVTPEGEQVFSDQFIAPSPSSDSVYVADPVLFKPPTSGNNWVLENKEPLGHIPTEDDEEDSLLPMSQHSFCVALQNTIDSSSTESTCASVQSEYLPPSQVSCFPPVEEDEIPESSGKGPSSGSDQGYISKMSSQPEPLLKEDPLVALARLQAELFHQNLRFSDNGPEEC